MPLWTPPPLPETIQLTTRLGVTVTATGVDTKGAYIDLFNTTSLDAHGIWLTAKSMHTAVTATGGLLDVAVGGAGSEQIIIPDWNVGYCQNIQNAWGKQQFFCVFIPSGSIVRARLASAVSADTVLVHAALMEDPPFGFETLDSVTAYGVVTTGSKGTNVTSGAAAFGAWAPIVVSTTRDHYAWAVGMGGGADTTINANAGVYVELGVGAAAAEQAMGGRWNFSTHTVESVDGPIPPWPIWQPVPSGTRISARIFGGATSDILDVIAYGIG